MSRRQKAPKRRKKALAAAAEMCKLLDGYILVAHLQINSDSTNDE